MLAQAIDGLIAPMRRKEVSEDFLLSWYFVESEVKT
jgi:hypothetical protein